MMGEIDVVEFFARSDQHHTLRQRDRREMRGQQIELITRQCGQQPVVQGTPQIGGVHERLSPGRSGRLPQGGGKTLREDVPSGKLHLRTEKLSGRSAGCLSTRIECRFSAFPDGKARKPRESLSGTCPVSDIYFKIEGTIGFGIACRSLRLRRPMRNPATPLVPQMRSAGRCS